MPHGRVLRYPAGRPVRLQLHLRCDGRVLRVAPRVLLVVRPFRTHLSSAFAYLNASMMLCTAIVAYWSGRAGSGSSVATLLAVLFLICNAMFVVQFVSTAAHAIYRDEKRRRLRALDEAAVVRGAPSDSNGPVLMKPLLL